jgi:uncharacterized protein YjeT (DUF2065 family)
MVTQVVFGALSLAWFWAGLELVAAPASWRAGVRRWVSDPLRRLLVAQGLMLAGLVLITGSAPLRGRWAWTVLGVIVAAKGTALLALSDHGRESWLAAGDRLPEAAYRLAGVINVALATLLAIDTLR